jgi:hypothetical protein
MLDSHQEEFFVEPQRSLGPKLLAGLAALIVTALVFTGYALLRKRHAQSSASVVLVSSGAPVEQKPPKALVMVDEALLQGNKTIIGGTVRNTSTEKLEAVSVEMELKRRKDGVAETQIVALEPAQLEPDQEGRYALQLRVQDYGSARLVALKAGPKLEPLPFATAPGLKRPPERLETKTITVGKPASKGGGFLNSPDNPARVP